MAHIKIPLQIDSDYQNRVIKAVNGEREIQTKYSKSNFYCYSNLITKNKTDNVGKKERQNMISDRQEGRYK